MAETNGHAPPELEPVAPTPAPAAELDALLAGLYEPVTYELAPGRTLELRPLMLGRADKLYAGLTGAELQAFLLSRCVYVGGRPLGDDNAARLPVPLANKLVPILMRANGMEGFLSPDDDAGGGGEGADPKA